jgi:bifunctional non-homologous end joining protein LigD
MNDGYQALLLRDGKEARILSRNEKDLTHQYPALVSAALQLDARQFMLDGEITALDESGRPSFQGLQHRSSHPNYQIVFYAFDVLNFKGQSLTSRPLTERRGYLPEVIEKPGRLRVSQELPGSAPDIVEAVRAAGLEGIIAKRRDSLYQPGERSSDWVKLKLEKQQEFVIGGYRPDGANGVDALLVGYYKGKSLLFAGKVRAGMVPHVRRELFKQLKPLRITECSFANLPDSVTGRWGGGITAAQMAEMHWIRPQRVAQIRFAEWTSEGRLRLAKYLGLRDDKAARDVRRES